MSDDPALAVDQALGVLRSAARVRSTIAYSDFARLIDALPGLKEHEDERLEWLLDEVSRTEHSANRGLISALVVTRSSGQPGRGFFRLVRQLRRSSWLGGSPDPELFNREREFVFAAYAVPPAVSPIELELTVRFDAVRRR
jgi:hypothetical protein